MHLNKQIVPAWFYDLANQECPGLLKAPVYWKLFSFLCFQVPRKWHPHEEEEDVWPISRRFLATLEGKEKAFRNHRYNADAFLKRFQADVTTLNIRKASQTDNRCRQVREMHLNPVMRNAVDLVIGSRVSQQGGQVYVATGNKVTTRAIRQDIAASRADALSMAHKAGCQDARDLLDYMNNLGSYRFSEMLQYMDDARAKVGTMSHADMHLRMLREIEMYCQPFYHATPRSVRVFASGASLQGLHRDLRKILTQGWYECDLQSAHLAIIANLWKMPKIDAYLSSGADIWQDLCTDCCLPYTEAWKDKLKKVFYSLVYGDNKGNMTLKLIKRGIDRNRFFGNPIVAEILTKRDAEMMKIEAAGGARDVYGRWIDTKETVKKGKKKGMQVLNTKSILSQVSQAMELKLMYPIVALARQNANPDGFAITLYQYDGCSISCKGQKSQRWKSRIEQAVNSVAKSLGVNTKLIWKN